MEESRIKTVFLKYSVLSSSDPSLLQLPLDHYKAAVLALSGNKPPKSAVQRLYSALCQEGRTMDLDTFTALQCEQDQILNNQGDVLKLVFQTMDLSCNGFVSKSDFVRCVREVMPRFRGAEQMFDKVDWDCDGRVSWRDFVSIMAG